MSRRRLVTYVVIVIIAFVGLNAAGYFGGYYARWFKAPFEGRLEMREQVFSGPSQLVRYEHFFNLCAGIQADEVRISNYKTDLADPSIPDEDKRKMRTELRGVEGHRAGLVTRYNAEATKEDTSANFLAANLPYQISMGGNTICGR